MTSHKELADRFYCQLLSGNRTTYVYSIDGEYIAEISLVREMNDPDYTVSGKRIYVSHLIVKPDRRRQGIGRKLVDHVTDIAGKQGYCEMSIGVDLNNYPALKLYTEAGFDKVVYIGEDEQGQFIKLLKTL